MKFKLLTDLEIQCVRDAILTDIIVKMGVIGECDKKLADLPENNQAPVYIRKVAVQNRLHTLKQLLAQVKTDIAVRGLKPETETGEQTDEENE